MKKFFIILAISFIALNTNAKELIERDLSNSYSKTNAWSFDDDGILSSSEDEILWTKDTYENFILEAQVKVSEAGNGGIIVYSNKSDESWAEDSIEIQIADNDYFLKKLRQAYYSSFGGIFGIQAPYMDATKPLGAWNKLKISCEGKNIKVYLNGRLVNNLDLNKCISASIAPDGSSIPTHLQKTPRAKLATKGFIGLQGRHGKGNVVYKDITIIDL